MMKTIFNTFVLTSLINFSIFSQKSDCKYWLTTERNFVATMIFNNESHAYFVINQNRNYVLKDFKFLPDSTIIINNDVEDMKLLSLSPDTLAIKPRNERTIKFHCVTDEVFKHKLDNLISLKCKSIESFNNDSLFLGEIDNKPVFVDFKGLKVATFEKVLSMDSTGFFVRQNDKWKLLDSHFKESTTISGSFSEVIKNETSDFAVAKGNNNWGYIHGSLFIKPQFRTALFYGHGLLPVLTKNKRWIFLDNVAGKNSYSKLSFIKKPIYKMSYWLAETPTEIFEIKQHYFKRFLKSELKSKSKKK
jgi:hypothetical protein